MKSVRDIEADLAKLSPKELNEIAAWIEDFLEDQLEIRPEFLESIDRARQELSQGKGRVVKP